MHHLSSGTPSTTKRLRPAAARVSAGASSMLRLSRGVEPRLPTAPALSDWVERVSGMMDLTPLADERPAGVGPRSAPYGFPPPKTEKFN
ncbi:MAG: hypothetical protein J0L57_10870, partial [Burkholderiales bacterium]|nr:hypothetical protein [Burkholderiales bacterium]